jgi:hypothetical protein
MLAYQKSGRFDILLEIKKKGEKQIIFRINFNNPNDVMQNLYFSNKSRSAESLGLKILLDGKRIDPIEVNHVNLRDSEIKPVRIDAYSAWAYDLVSDYNNGLLRFKGAGYLLKPGKLYNISFSYEGMESNTVEFRAE